MEAGEITATIRIEKSGSNYLLSLNGTHKKSRTTFMDNKKKRVTAAEYSSFTISDLKRKLLAGPFVQTSPGGIYHDTMSKKPVQDADKMESIGMRAHDSFVKEYDVSFNYDPAYLYDPSGTTLTTTSSAAAPVAPGGTSVQRRQSNLGLSSALSQEHRPMTVRVTVHIDGENHVLKLKGISPLYNPNQVISIKSKEFPELRISDLLDKLDDTWPKFERGGQILLPNNRGTDSFSNRTKLETLGLEGTKGQKKKYDLLFELDSAAAAAAVPRSGIHEGTIGVNVRIFFDNGIFNLQLTGSGGDFRGDMEINFRKEEYNGLTFGELKKRLRRWPETASSGKFHTQSGNIAFTDQDKLVNIGLTAGTDGLPIVHQFSWEMI